MSSDTEYIEAIRRVSGTVLNPGRKGSSNAILTKIELTRRLSGTKSAIIEVISFI